MRTTARRILSIFVLASVLASCRSVRVGQYGIEGIEPIVETAYSEYVSTGADGTDINAMLSYFPLSLMTNSNVVATWDGYMVCLSRYLEMAGKEHISENYSLAAGTNEVAVVSNFFSNAISNLKGANVDPKEVPYALSSAAQTLLIKIHKKEYEKNE